MNSPNTSCCGTAKSNNRSAIRYLHYFKSVWALIVLIPAAMLLIDPNQVQQLLLIAVRALVNTAPYIAIAVLLIAYLKASGSENMIAQAFQGREHRMILVAALIGGLAPFCSCEVIPFIAGLLAVGVPLSAVMAFWLSSPLIDPPTLMITAGALGWDFAIGKAIGAIFLGVLGGYTIKLGTTHGGFAFPLRNTPVTSCSGSRCGGQQPLVQRPKWRIWGDSQRIDSFRKQALENGLFLLKWLSFAYLLEALLILYVPAETIAGAVGGEGILPIIVGALVGMPAYLNSYAAPPLVAALVEQGMSAGSAMAFMLAGAISSIPAMAAVWSLVRPPVFIAYLGLGLSGAIIFASAYSLAVSV